MAGSAMPTTVASRLAMPEPRTVAAMTQRPRAVPYERGSGGSSRPGVDSIIGQLTLAFSVKVTRPARRRAGHRRETGLG